MPSRKQRRRRLKERRHEYEYVYVDEEGREVELDEAEERPEAKSDGKASKAAPGRRPARKVEPPSWRRVGKRALIFAPIMFLTLSLVADELTYVERAFQTLVLLTFFLPFSYVMDSMMYRAYLRRGGQPAGNAPSGRR